MAVEQVIWLLRQQKVAVSEWMSFLAEGPGTRTAVICRFSKLSGVETADKPSGLHLRFSRSTSRWHGRVRCELFEKAWLIVWYQGSYYPSSKPIIAADSILVFSWCTNYSLKPVLCDLRSFTPLYSLPSLNSSMGNLPMIGFFGLVNFRSPKGFHL